MSAFSPPLGRLQARPLLVAEAKASEAQCFVLVGGPGAGKSATALLLAQAWGLPAVVLQASQLGAAEGHMAQTPQLGLRDGPLPQQAVWSAQHPEGFCLVVDGLEQVGPEALRWLASWLDQSPPGCRTVLCSRQPVPLPWARRLAQGQVRFWGPKELFLRPEEWGQLAPDGKGEAGPLLRGMGGWPLGAYALASRPDADEALAIALVAEAWLAELPPAFAKALGPLSLWPELEEGVLEALGLAFLDPASGASAQAEGSLAFLKRWGLVQDDAYGRLVWVPWVRRALQAAWRAATSPEDQAKAEGLAGAWLAEHDPMAAILALLAKGSVVEAVALVKPWGGKLRKAGDFAGLAALLNALPMAFRVSQPAVLLLEGALLQAQGEHAEAEARYDAAASLFELEGDAPGAFEALGDLLHLHWTRQQLEAFDRTAERAAAFEPQAELAERVEYLNNLACRRFGAGDEAEAKKLFRKVLDLPHFGEAQVASVQQFASINLGIVAMEAGAFDEATRHFERVLHLASTFALKPSVPRGARLYLAGIALKLGDRARAEAAFQALAEHPFPAEERHRQAEFLSLEGDYHLLTGAQAEAEACYRQALDAFAEIRMDESADAGAALNKLAVLHRRRGELEAATRLHERALGMVGEWPRYEAAVRLDWAITWMEASEPLAAAAQLEAALACFAKAPAPHLEAGVRLAVAVLAERQGERGAALSALGEGLALLRQGPYYYVAIAQRELAPQLWALLVAAGETALLGRIESHFPVAAGRIREAIAREAQAPSGPAPSAGPLAVSGKASASPAAAPDQASVLPPQAPPALALRCFGLLELSVAGEPVTAWPRKKAKALLALLLLNPRGFGREELAETLFPELGGEEAAHQLDNLASALRKLLEPDLARRQASRYLSIKDKHYRFVGEGLWVDHHEFERLSREGQSLLAQGQREAGLQAFEEAVALYRGDLLSEPLLLEWFDLERTRCRTRVCELLSQLAHATFEAGHHEAARAHAERLLALDPTSEEGHRCLMALYAHFGQRGLVQQQYALCERVLAEQLNAKPSEATRALSLALLGETQSPA